MDIESTNLSELSWEELMEFRAKIIQEQENLEAAVSVIKDEMVARLEEEGMDGKIVGDKTISIRTSYTTDKETARELGAIKTVTSERIDVAMIKALYFKKVEIPNLQIIKSPAVLDVIRKPKEEENEN